MIEVKYSRNFLKVAAKLPTKIYQKLEEQDSVFRQDPQDPRLRGKALTGQLKGLYSFRVSRNYRVLYRPLGQGRFLFYDVDDRKNIYR